ncbi:reverse transcriptase domain, Reverse transcriptase zinc-binding domain protein [Artemisia annua]|uniref:Reverse transcriptase domain, Reverse transcriptase zinc-binding domain protein n=1 Tax=Artemisia annua TaxID=35608 RepID=A0A2U1LA65_ARTAN|nr:reverse transcriptase domain, Reverse transcriptase zinc-binding domain protein [Artemisia annua]
MCPLCNTVDETHAHLFFACSFSKSIWDNLKILCKLDNVSCVWAEIVSGISIRVASNSIWSVIQRLVFGAAVYYIWHKLLGLKIKRSVDSVKAADIWKIPLLSSNAGSAGIVKERVSGDAICFLNEVKVKIWCCSLLCTTEGRVASCAGHQFVVWVLGWLCTTGTDPDFCAGILYCFSPAFKLSIYAFYGPYVYGDVWNSIGWSLWNPPWIQSTYVVLDQAVFILSLKARET